MTGGRPMARVGGQVIPDGALWKRYDFAMGETIRQSELRNDNAAIMRRVAGGESFVVTVNGRPVADLVPHQREHSRRRFVPTRELADALAALPALDVDAWTRETAEADHVFGPDTISDPFEQRAPRDRDGGHRG
jgi:prevent-host-death family protein